MGLVLLSASLFSGCRTMTCAIDPVTGGVNQNNRNAYQMPDLEAITASDTSFSVKTGEIRYTLPEDGYVRIRIGLNQAGALLRTLIDWEYRSAGEHVEVWDKKDESGLIDFGDRSDYLLVLNARPENAKAAYPKAPRLTITFPESIRRTAGGVAVVSGIAHMRVELDPEDNKRLSESQFEVAIYSDTVFMIEDEIATNPFNYRIDVSKFNEGEHVMTVNVISYDGQVGTASVKMYVEK